MAIPTAASRANASPQRFLSKAFKTALAGASWARRFVFLELCSNKGQLSRALRRRGAAAITIDRTLSRCLDVEDARVTSHIRGWIRGGCASCLWIPPPSNSAQVALLSTHLQIIMHAALGRGTPIVFGRSSPRW